jgi:shikimate dehydrogenase
VAVSPFNSQLSTSFLKLGIVGHPLSHTLSPLLHAALLQHAGLTGEYLKYDVDADTLAKTLDAFQAAGGRGLNVTIPHKLAVMPLLNEVSPNAQILGAVNTVIFTRTGKRIGENTDIIGFIRSLPLPVQDHLPHSRVLLLGAGGSARAVLAGLLQLKTAHVTLMARQLEKATALEKAALAMKSAFNASTELAVCTFEEARNLEPVQSIINSTPVGMWPNTNDSPLEFNTLTHLLDAAPEKQEHRFVYDLIYRPLQTQLLGMAESLRVPTFNGLDMLILQGLAAFELWSETTLPSERLESLRELLKRSL